jgi:hypothetical protein
VKFELRSIGIFFADNNMSRKTMGGVLSTWKSQPPDLSEEKNINYSNA